MAASPLSPGRLLASVCGRGAASRSSASGSRARETLARRLLEQILMDPAARDAFTRRIAGSQHSALSVRPATGGGGEVFDLTAQLADESGAESIRTARIGILLRSGRGISPQEVTDALAALSPSEDSRLVIIVSKGGRPEETAESAEAVAQGRLVITTWKALAKELSRKAKDAPYAPAWQFVADLCESSPDPTSRPLVAPRILLDEEIVAEFRAQLDAFRLIAEQLVGRPATFSTRRTPHGAWLHAGGSGRVLGVEFDEVEDGTPIRAVAARPHRTQPLAIGALGQDADREAALARLREITATTDWRLDPAFRTDPQGLIGAPASRGVEDARALLWEVLDPTALAEAGFPLVARRQPALDGQRLAVRVAAADHPRSGTFLVSVGGSRTWRTLLPRVTREFDGRTYIVQARRNDEAADLVAGVHSALRSLATKP